MEALAFLKGWKGRKGALYYNRNNSHKLKTEATIAEFSKLEEHCPNETLFCLAWRLSVIKQGESAVSQSGHLSFHIQEKAQ